MTYVDIVVEDELSEFVLKKTIAYANKNLIVENCMGGNGIGYIKKHASALNKAAVNYPYIILCDLDTTECAPQLKAKLLNHPQNSNLIFRIAVREVESWLLADRESFSGFTGVSVKRIPVNPDDVDDPKRELINIVRRSKKRNLRESIVPKENSTAKTGPDYNGALFEYVKEHWNVQKAMINSPSLKKAVEEIKNFKV